MILDGLSDAQRAAVTRPAGPMLLVGGPGTGKTRTLAHRFAWLVEQGAPAEGVLAIALSERARLELIGMVSELVEPPYDELHVHTFASFCHRLLVDEALEAGLDPGFATVTRADRVALLLDQLDGLTLRRHEIRGNPAPLLASFVERIDLLKQEMVTPEDCLERALRLEGQAGDASDAARVVAAREAEFAQLYADHDRLLTEQGALDAGDLVLQAFRLLHERPHVRERVAARFPHVLVDEYQELDFAQGTLLGILCEDGSRLAAFGDDTQTVHRAHGAGAKNIAELRRELPPDAVLTLDEGMRCAAPIANAAEAVTASLAERWTSAPSGGGEGEVRFWRCASTRAQAQALAAEAERLIAAGTPPDAIAVLVRSLEEDGMVIEAALEERAVPYRTQGLAAYFQRAEVRDVLAWLRVLADPGDSGAAVRALTRAPIELHSVDIARLTQLARRRKLDMPSAVAAALDGPQLSPEGRDRAQSFLRLYRAASAAFESRRPDAFVLRLVERIGLRRQQVFATQADTVARLRGIARLPELATAYMRRQPQATPRDFTRYLMAVADSELREEEPPDRGGSPAVAVLAVESSKGQEFDHVFVVGLSAAQMPGRPHAAAPTVPDDLLKERAPEGSHEDDMRRRLNVAMTRARRGLVLSWTEAPDGALAQPSPFVEEARAALGAEEEVIEEELFGPAEGLHSAFRIMRDELLDTAARVGGLLGEMRLDTTLDVSEAVARYLELLKVAAVIERSKAGQPIDQALMEVNQLLAQGASPEQREIVESSALDDWLRDAGRDPDRRPAAGGEAEGPSLDPFIPRRRGAGAPAAGLMLSASDIETYRVCPLKYKFARVFRIPQEPTINQRFGIALHSVLERFHKLPSPSRDDLLDLFDAAWRRGGFGDSDDELQFRERGLEALERYWEQTRDDEGEPTWFERSFSFKLGPHVVRGRIDRVDRRADGSYELIDYKTGKSKSEDELRRDVQLSIYQMGARAAWGLKTSAQSYYYVMTGEKVPVASSEEELERVRATVTEIGEGILRQDFQPTPSREICAFCDYRIICPAAER